MIPLPLPDAECRIVCEFPERDLQGAPALLLLSTLLRAATPGNTDIGISATTGSCSTTPP